MFIDEKEQGSTYEAQQLPVQDEFRQRAQHAPGQGGRIHTRFFYTSFALLNICIGLSVGYLCVRYSRFSVTNWGIRPDSPIPKEIFTMRRDAVFAVDSSYTDTGNADLHWGAVTDGSDAIYLPEPERYGLRAADAQAPTSVSGEPRTSSASAPSANNFFVLSALRQLRCTDFIRKQYKMLVYKPDDLSKNRTEKDWIDHVEDCFEYLRQSITCADYMSFESDTPPGSPIELTEGRLTWGGKHSCIDWYGLLQWREDQLHLYKATQNP